MNKNTKKVDFSELPWDWFENSQLYSSNKSSRPKRHADVVRTRVVLLFY
jgi:hypothetical protein